ncbi:hypothetical protein [Lederbergia citrisecunda]
MTINKMREVYVVVADLTRRELIRLLVDIEELLLHELTSQFDWGYGVPNT